LPVTIASASTGLAITDSQVLGGAGTVAQYIRGDGSLADFPATTGGGASVSYYLNGSVSQGTIGGVAYREVNRNPVFGAGTDISISSDGYIASFITDAGDPNKLEIPAGNWNLETYFSASSGGGNPSFYVELYKYNGLTFTLIASSATSPELIAFGTNLNPYFSTLAVPQTTLSLTDRLALRYYVNTSGRTITLHTENNHLCQVITTFTTGLTALNGLTTQVQFFAVGTSGTDFAISSATDTHTFNLPTASATNRGALSSADWSTFNGKQNALGYTPVPETRTITINGTTQDLSTNRTYNVGDMLLNTYQAVTGTKIFDPNRLLMAGEGTAQPTSLSNTQVSIAALTGHNSFGFNSSNNIYFNKGTTANGGIIAFSNSATRTYTLKDASGTLAFTSDIPTNPVGGTGTTNTIPKFTGSTTIGNSLLTDNGTTLAYGNNIISVGASNTSEKYLEFGSSNGAFYVGGTSSEHYIFGQGDKPLRLYTNGTVKATLTSGGNLLVGTTTDGGFKLDVNGTGRFSDQLTTTYGLARIQVTSTTNSSNSGFRLGAKDSSGTTKNAGLYYTAGTTTANTYLALFADDNNPQLAVLANGNVGIGTTSPTPFLNANARTLAINSSGTNPAELAITGQNANVYLGNGGLAAYLYSTGDFPLIFGTNGSERMRITSGGNVLIGTTTDGGQRLQVNGAIKSIVSSGGSVITSESTATNGEGQFVIIGKNSSGTTRSASFKYDNADLLRIGTSSAIDFRFETNDTERMRITSGGNVLIGTTTDAGQKMQVYSSGATRVRIDGGGNNSGVLLSESGTNQWSLASVSNSLLFYNEVNSATRMAITSGGNLLVGTTTDAGFRLQVHGADGTSYLKLTSTVATTGGRIGYNGDELRIDQQQNADLTLRTNGSERMRITSGGNLLIGTSTNGASKLRISGLPTSSSGLSSGDIWNDSGTLKIA
jgi:hypothetical protein